MHIRRRPHPGSSWQFVRQTDRISIVRPDGLSLLVGRPHVSQTRYRFANENAVQAFQVTLAETLTGSGWLLCPTAFRRHR